MIPSSASQTRRTRLCGLTLARCCWLLDQTRLTHSWLNGPPPLLLSTGDYLFLHNSAGPDGYHPSWAILSGADPSIVLARADEPLLSPTLPWEEGVAPYVHTYTCSLRKLLMYAIGCICRWTCNVQNVVFLEGAQPTEQPDVFRVFFGGADAVVGTALIAVKMQ